MSRMSLFNWIKVVLIVYALIGIAFYYLQDRILLHPTLLESNYKFEFNRKFKEVNIAINNTDTINVVQFMPASDSPKAVVLYFHGNRDNIERYEKFIDPFLNNNCAVWMVDYPGFGKSRGAFNEKTVYRMGYELQKLAATSFSADSIIIYGKSLGTGVAAYVASETKNKMLILETPYYSFKDAVSKYLFMYPIDRIMHFEFPTYKYLDGLAEPIIIFHGTSDGVIRYSSAARLKAYLKPNDVFYTIEGAGHNNVKSNEIYYKAIDSLLK